MVIPAVFRKFRVIFRCKQHRIADKLAVMQKRASVRRADFVVPVNNKAFIACVNRVVIYVLLYVNNISRIFSAQNRILAFKCLAVAQVNDKQISAFLQIRYSRFPENIQEINFLYLNIPQPVLNLAVPENSVCRCSVLKLVPPVVAVGFLKIVVLKHRR